ncbi:MAG: DnaB-like helicase C-terminal domain-containing protein, partial [Bacteroidales bacterium]|nr:DnaB-like helicase C-terminal domain-containing protein [Bacteroidales bacterium]
ISKGMLDDNEWVRLMDRIQTLNAAPLYIDDTPALTVFDLRAKCRRLKNRYDIQLVIVDYLQLMRGGAEDSKGNGNREQEISFISRSLKSLARELNVPVIALSQLSRAVETRSGSKRPMLSDLRESGAIEQDADLVSFIYRPEYYKMEKFEDDTPSEGQADIMIEKNRHGAQAWIRVRFEKQYTKFSDVDEIYSFDTPASEGITNNEDFATMPSKMNNDEDEFPY